MLKTVAKSAFVLAALLTATASARAQTPSPVHTLPGGQPTSAIFIGNSFFYYNNGIHSQVQSLIRAADANAAFRTTMVTISGAGIDWHDVDSYFRPGAIGRYSFDAGNNVVFNKIDKLFDAAIIMDCSQCPIHPELKSVFETFVKKNTDSIRKNGAEPLLFMSWAYADKPEMTAALADAYTRAGNAHKALVIPAGLAFARAIAQRPDINLYASDKRHPSPAGTYLAAATTYAALTGKSPADLKFAATLDQATAAALQTIAWDTVTDYRKK